MSSISSRVGAGVVSAAVMCGAVLTARPAGAQGATGRFDALQELNASVESVVQRVEQSVVQVLVTSGAPRQEGTRGNTDLPVGRQRIVGSGIAVDAGGYIVTNAHVIDNATRIEVVLPARSDAGGGMRSLVRGRGRTVDAAIVGVAPEIDLALLKVEDAHLPAIPMADYDGLRQGELVFAFGSPEGLRNSVTMGIVSAVARQPDPDSPMVYVQTDAPINRGNSGGPLVNVKGELVGINTLILTDSGGSQGLGFAIPSTLVQIAWSRLRRYGDLHRGEIGVVLQTITPTLATGLGLSRDWGAMISDVAPGGPAAAAGLKTQDIVTSIDGEPIDGLPRLAFQLYTRSAGDRVRLGVLRGSDMLTFEVPVGERTHDFGRLTDAAEPTKSLVTRLAIFGVDIGDAGADLASALRVPSGVLVVGHSPDEGAIIETGLLAGDTIHGINGTPVTSVTDLQTALDRLKPRSPVALQIERNGQLTFLAFELD
jgi:serine protease Do